MTPGETHYHVLGLEPFASPEDIRASYRRLARQLHPDVNPDPSAVERFLEVQKAYEVLTDEARREAYDGILRQAAERDRKESAEERRRRRDLEEAEELRRRAEERMRDVPRPAQIDVRETERLADLMQASKYAEAEALAHKLLSVERRQPFPYAVLGDIARFRGETRRAVEYYGYAAQFEPNNPIYQRKYEELIRGGSGSVKVNPTTQIPEVRSTPLAVCGFLVLVMAFYVALSPEPPLGLPIVPRWTLGVLVMMPLAGLVTGVGLSLSGLLDKFRAVTGAAVASLSPATWVVLLSCVSFWLSCCYYVVLGQTQNAFNRSVSCWLGSVLAVVAVFALAGLAKGPDFAVQNLFWGGNLILLTSCLGWTLGDALRGADLA